MCMQRTWIMNDEDWAYELFIEKASEEEISRFADNKCLWCKGRGLFDNVLDDRSGYSELCVCDCKCFVVFHFIPFCYSGSL